MWHSSHTSWFSLKWAGKQERFSADHLLTRLSLNKFFIPHVFGCMGPEVGGKQRGEEAVIVLWAYMKQILASFFFFLSSSLKSFEDGLKLLNRSEPETPGSFSANSGS